MTARKPRFHCYLCGAYWPDRDALIHHFEWRCWPSYWARNHRYPQALYRLKYVRSDEATPRISRYAPGVLDVALRRAEKENGGKYGSRSMPVWDADGHRVRPYREQYAPWYVVQNGLDWWYELFAPRVAVV